MMECGVTGGDCGGRSQSQILASHFTEDKALRDEGLHPSDSPITCSEQLVREFLDERLTDGSNPFDMGHLLHHLDTIENGIAKPHAGNLWAHEFTSIAHNDSHSSSHIQSVGEMGWMTEPRGSGAGLVMAPLNDQQYVHHDQDPTDAFRNAAAEFLQMADENNDLKLLKSEFGDFMRKVCDGEEIDSQTLVDPGLSSTSSTSQPSLSNQWSQQFVHEMKGNKSESVRWQEEKEREDEKGFWDRMASEWNKISASENIPWLSEFYDFSSLNKEYNFSGENPMENLVNAVEEGRKRLEQGDLPGAVLCFEAAVKQDPQQALAWQLLGTTQAENEQDLQAIAALNKCISLDPRNLTALMALAVSYTNESYQNQACKALKEWIKMNPKYSDLLRNEGLIRPDDSKTVSSIMSKQLYHEVKELLLEAARRNPQESIDADVQTGLSVVFNLSGEVDLAADCCTAALSVRPHDWRLWNRLGATLANGGRSEEAVEAYRNALELSPGFIRARYNLGISCVHLKAYREAAEHLLTALNQQMRGVGLEGESGSSMSDTIWTTLRLVISLLERPDLMPHINNRDLSELNKAFNME